MDFKDHWNLDTALKVVQNKTVDSKLWAEAVEWLLLYGPPEVVSILLQASGHATERVYPELESTNYTHDGSTAYDITKLAKSLGLSEEEIRKIIKEREESNQMVHFVRDDTSSETIH
jgi:hypothetical protein